MTIKEYIKKWNRDEANNLATFTAHWLKGDPDALRALEEITIDDACPYDMDDYNITDAQEWLDANVAALTELKR